MKLQSYCLYVGILGLGLAGLTTGPAFANHGQQLFLDDSGPCCGRWLNPWIDPSTPDLLLHSASTEDETAAIAGSSGVKPSAWRGNLLRAKYTPFAEGDSLSRGAIEVDAIEVDAIDETVLTTAAALLPPDRLSTPKTADSDFPTAIAVSWLPLSSNPAALQDGGLAQVVNENPPVLPDNLDELPGDPELGVIRVRSPQEDPELGILRIRQQPDIPALPSQEPSPIAFLTARFSALSSDNILLILNDVGGLTGGNFIRPAVSLEFYPPLGPQTALIGAVDFGLQRYINQPSFNYDDLRVRLGIWQGFSPRAYGQLSFTYQELTRPGGSPSKFFDNSALSLTLGRRDPIISGLVLDTFYQIQYNDAVSLQYTDTDTLVTDFSRFSQLAGAYLGYTINPQFQAGVIYQLNLIDYTVQDRYDTIQQLLGQLIYSLTPNVRFSFYGGFSFGRSSDPRVKFDDTLFGLTIEATTALF